MVKRMFAKTSDGGRDGLMPSRKRRIRAGLGLAAAALMVLAILTLPAIVFASGVAPGVSVSPDSRSVGTHVSVTGSHSEAGDKIVVGYPSGNCSSGVTTV